MISNTKTVGFWGFNEKGSVVEQPQYSRKYAPTDRTLEQTLANIDNRSLRPKDDSPTLRTIGYF